MKSSDYKLLKYFIGYGVTIKDLEKVLDEGVSADDIAYLFIQGFEPDQMAEIHQNYDLERWRDLVFELEESGHEVYVDEIMELLDTDKRIRKLFNEGS